MAREFGNRNAKTERRVKHILQFLDRYEGALTVRQIFYLFVSLPDNDPLWGPPPGYRDPEVWSWRRIENNDEGYDAVVHLCRTGREDGVIPYHRIVDRSRPINRTTSFDDIKEYLESCKAGYVRNYWQGQPVHVELWIEKDTISGSIEDIREEYQLISRVGRGHQSLSMVRRTAHEFIEIQKLGLPIHILYIGDFDPSGKAMERVADRVARQVMAIRERKTLTQVNNELRGPRHRDGSYGYIPIPDKARGFTFTRIAVLEEDKRNFNLPTVKIKRDVYDDEGLLLKKGDPNAEDFISEYGLRSAVEVEALPPDVLNQRIREAVEGRYNPELFEAQRDKEEKDMEKLKRVIGQIRIRG